MSYRRTNADKAKALALVLVLHVALGSALLFGLAGGSVERVSEALKSFDVREPPPPPQPEPPPPDDSESAEKDEAAPPDLRAKPAPVVAPKPPIPLPIPSPVRTADERAPIEGADRSAGAAAVAGPGTGAGGTGSGFGGGGAGGSGSGTGSGPASPARLVRGIRSRLDARLLQALPFDRGEVPLALIVGANGTVTRCEPAATSGSAALDAELCRRMTERSRWEPARDRAGRPVAVSVRYTATWSKN